MKFNSNRLLNGQLIGLIAMMSIAFTIANIYYYKHETIVVQNDKHNELQSIANLKSKQLTQWHKERLSEVNFFSRSEPQAHYINEILDGKRGTVKALRESLLRIMTNQRYSDIFLLNKKGTIVFSVLSIKTIKDTSILVFSNEVFKTRKIKVSDFYYCNEHHEVHLDILAPIFTTDNQVSGLLVFRIRPSDFLYPLIQDWPVPSKTSETVLVRREGDSVLYLNPLNDSSNLKLQKRVSINETARPIVLAALGKTGQVAGLDYKNHTVFGHICKVPETPWFMFVKIDTSELYADLNARTILLVIISFFFILFVAAILTWIYYNRQRTILRELLYKKSELHQSLEEFGATIYSIGDGVITTDLNGLVKQMNPIAEKWTGWTEKEAKGESIESILRLVDEKNREAVLCPVGQVLREGIKVDLINHPILLSKKDQAIPIDINVSPVKDKNGMLLGAVIVFRNKTEERLRHQLTDIRLNLFEYSSRHTLQETLRYMLDEIGLFTQSPIAFIHFFMPDHETLWLQCSSTSMDSMLNEKGEKNKENILNENDAWADCLRLKKPIVINHDAKKVSQSSESNPFYRELIIPVFRSQKIIAVLNLRNKSTDYMDIDVETVSYLADVTWEIAEIKIKEEKLRESEDTIRLLFNSTAEGIYGINTEGNCIFCNKAALQVLGYEQEEDLVGKNMHQLIHHSHQDGSPLPEDNCKVRHVIHDNIGIHINDEVFWKKDGTNFPVEYWSYPIVRDDMTLGSVVTFQDISQKRYDDNVQQIVYDIARYSMSSKSLEELLIFVREELNRVIDTTNFYVALYDQVSDSLQEIIEVNEKKEIEDWQKDKPLSRQVLNTGKALMLNKEDLLNFQLKHHLKQNGIPLQCWLGVPLMVEDKAIGLIAVLSYQKSMAYTTSTARLLEIVAHELSIVIQRTKMIQDLINEKENAEESDRLKTAFLANMSHEIRTPMNGIIGFLDLLSKPDLVESDKKVYIEIVNKSSERLLETINDIIEVSKIEAGETNVILSDIDMEEFMQFYLDFFKPQATEKGLELILSDIITGTVAQIKSDRQKLDSILTNLIKNAIKFTSEGQIEFGNYLENDKLFFYVKDTGRGIPSNRINAIFERFVQADLNLTRNHEGSGLGLSIVQAYIKSLGGTISVESELEKGSLFSFSIPYIPSDPPIKLVDMLQNETKLLKKGMTILIAEDDPSSFLFLELTLRKEAINIVHTINGEDTVEYVKEHPETALVLMDVKMPGMDGFQATIKIREFNTIIPIIFQTAYALTGDKEIALKAGGTDYISKPIQQSLLLELIYKYTNDNLFEKGVKID